MILTYIFYKNNIIFSQILIIFFIVLPKGTIKCCGYEDCHNKECEGYTTVTSVTGKKYACCGKRDCYVKSCDNFIHTPDHAFVCCGYENCLLPPQLYICDFATRYIGHYIDAGKTAVFTGAVGGGTPYFTFAGFDEEMNGRTVEMEIQSLTDYNPFFEKRRFIIHHQEHQDWYNLDGRYMGRSPLGFVFHKGWIHHGGWLITINLLDVEDLHVATTIKYKLITDIWGLPLP